MGGVRNRRIEPIRLPVYGWPGGGDTVLSVYLPAPSTRYTLRIRTTSILRPAAR